MCASQATKIGYDMNRTAKLAGEAVSRLSTKNRYRDDAGFNKRFEEVLNRNQQKKLNEEYQKVKPKNADKTSAVKHDEKENKKKVMKKNSDHDPAHKIDGENPTAKNENSHKKTEAAEKSGDTQSSSNQNEKTQLATNKGALKEMNSNLLPESVVSHTQTNQSRDHKGKPILLIGNNSHQKMSEDKPSNTLKKGLPVEQLNIEVKEHAKNPADGSDKLSMLKNESMSNKLAGIELEEGKIKKNHIKANSLIGNSDKQQVLGKKSDAKSIQLTSQAFANSMQQTSKNTPGLLTKAMGAGHGHSDEAASLKDTSESIPEPANSSKTPIDGKASGIDGMSALRQNHIKSGAVPLSAPEASPGKVLPEQSVDKIIKNLMYVVKTNQSEIKIDLRPELLGNMHVAIVAKNSKININITTDSNSIKEFIETSIGQLRTEFSNHKLNVDEIEVGVNNEFSRQPDKQKTFNGQLFDAASDIETGEEDFEDNKINPQPGGIQIGHEDNRIDYYV